MAGEVGLGPRIAQAAAIGVCSGTGFVLPMLVMLRVPADHGRAAWLLAALVAAVLLMRRLGKRLHRLLDRTDRPFRFPLLVLYGVATMLPPISLLLLPAWR